MHKHIAFIDADIDFLRNLTDLIERVSEYAANDHQIYIDADEQIQLIIIDEQE